MKINNARERILIIFQGKLLCQLLCLLAYQLFLNYLILKFNSFVNYYNHNYPYFQRSGAIIFLKIVLFVFNDHLFPQNYFRHFFLVSQDAMMKGVDF